MRHPDFLLKAKGIARTKMVGLANSLGQERVDARASAVHLCSPELVLGEVQIHFVSVKVSVVRAAVCIVHANCALALQHPAP